MENVLPKIKQMLSKELLTSVLYMTFLLKFDMPLTKYSELVVASYQYVHLFVSQETTIDHY